MNKFMKGLVLTFLLSIILFSSGCKKCGKEKSIKFKKGVDKTQSLWYNNIVRRR